MSTTFATRQEPKTGLRPKHVIHRCVGCGKTFPHRFNNFCDTCDAMVDVHYDLAGVQLYDSDNPLERFFDLLPIEKPENLLPVPMERTPAIHAEKLGKRLGLPWLYLKDETKLPTGTTKDRMAAVALSFMRECGIREFCTSSTGNSSSAFAKIAPLYPECRIYLFTGENWQYRVQFADSDQVIHFVLKDATFVDAFDCAGHFAKKHGLRSERGFFNPGRREGLKITLLEAAEQIPRPIDWYVQAVSSAMGVYGCHKGAKELHGLGLIPKVPRLLCVQQESCAPMVRAFHEGSATIKPEHIVHRPNGIAEAILRGNPSRAYPYVRQIVLETNGTMVSVSEAEIRAARRLVNELEGLDPCFSASTALAGLAKLVNKGAFPAQDTVMVNLTGSDRIRESDGSRVHWLRAVEGTGGAVKEWEPADPGDQATLALWS